MIFLVLAILPIVGDFLIYAFLFFYPYTLITIIDIGIMSDKANSGTPMVAALPQISKLSLNLSTPHRFSVFWFYFRLRNSTYFSINQYLQTKLHDKVFVDVVHFFTKFMLPISAIGIKLLNELIKNICNCFWDSKNWEIPNTYLNSVYVSWLIRIMSGIYKHAI